MIRKNISPGITRARDCLRWRALAVMAVVAALLAVPATGRATSVTPPSFAELVAESNAIVRASVTSISAAWADAGGQRVIKTHVSFRVKKNLKGVSPETLTLEFLGGTVGSESMQVSGMPQFAVGQTEILFVANNGAQFCPLVRMMHGRYRVLDDAARHRVYVARDDGAPLEKTDDVQLPADDGVLRQFRSAATALSPEEFEAHIAGEIEKSRRAP
jgi:hypothetical protein